MMLPVSPEDYLRSNLDGVLYHIETSYNIQMSTIIESLSYILNGYILFDEVIELGLAYYTSGLSASGLFLFLVFK